MIDDILRNIQIFTSLEAGKYVGFDYYIIVLYNNWYILLFANAIVFMVFLDSATRTIPGGNAA